MQDTYRYDPYGNSLAKAEGAMLANPWQYAGGYLDAESGLYLLGARYYDPGLGRFLQMDPLGGFEQYSYAGSNPCNNADPTGLIPCYKYFTPDQAQAESKHFSALEEDAKGARAVADFAAIEFGLIALAGGGVFAAAAAIAATVAAATFSAAADNYEQLSKDYASYTHGYYELSDSAFLYPQANYGLSCPQGYSSITPTDRSIPVIRIE